jgi:hypothetical protein
MGNEPASHARFRVKCDGLVVASTEGPLYRAWSGIMHYACQYAEEGAIRLEIHNGRRWVAFQNKLPSRTPTAEAVR